MKLCVLIPHYHKNKTSEWLLNICIKSLQRVEPSLIRHTMVIDDASPDPSKFPCLNKLQKELGIHLVFKQKNTSYSDVINLGMNLARKAKYEYALTLNNDVEMKTPFVDIAQQLFDKHPNLGAIGARLYFQDGRIQHQGFTFHGEQFDLHDAGQFGTERPSSFVMGVTGAFQIIDLNKCGQYPNGYPLSYEDVTFCLRNWERNIQSYYESRIVGIHCQSATRGTKIGVKELESMKQLGREVFNFDLIHENLKKATDSHQ